MALLYWSIFLKYIDYNFTVARRLVPGSRFVFPNTWELPTSVHPLGAPWAPHRFAKPVKKLECNFSNRGRLQKIAKI